MLAVIEYNMQNINAIISNYYTINQQAEIEKKARHQNQKVELLRVDIEMQTITNTENTVHQTTNYRRNEEAIMFFLPDIIYEMCILSNSQVQVNT